MSTKPTLTVQLMHAQARIAELEALLGNENLRTLELEQQLAEAKAAKPANTNRKVIAPRPEWVRPAWMEAARAKAMATGSVVLA